MQKNWTCSAFIQFFSAVTTNFTHLPDLNTFLKNIHQKWKAYREEKQDFERFLIFLNIKMSAKSNKIELSEEFMVMWREEQMSCPLCIETKTKKTKVSETATRGVL